MLAQQNVSPMRAMPGSEAAISGQVPMASLDENQLDSLNNEKGMPLNFEATQSGDECSDSAKKTWGVIGGIVVIVVIVVIAVVASSSDDASGSSPSVSLWAGTLKATHYWDCNGQGCDAATLQPWAPAKYISSYGYAPQNPDDHGGAIYGERLWGADLLFS